MALLISTIGIWAAFLYATVGEIITEKSGHLNLGTPGNMCIGAAGGFVGLSIYIKAVGGPENVVGFFVIVIPLLFAIVFSFLAGLLYSFLTVTLRTNQNITGLAITTFGMGIFKFLTGAMSNAADLRYGNILKYYRHMFPSYEKLGWFGKLFLSYGWMTYFAIIVAVVAAIIIKRTRVGLNLRAVGENPATADAAGLNVAKYRYGATITGAVISGLGGLFLIMDYLSCNNEAGDVTISAFGWLAVALVIFSIWNPKIAILGTFIFAFCYMGIISLNAMPTPKALLHAIPYLVTIIVLIITSVFGGKNVQPPQALGTNYFREDR